MTVSEIRQWDPLVTQHIKHWAGPVVKKWFRTEVRKLDKIPSHGPALVVANHSGGMLTPDVLVFAPAFYEHFGFDRPLFTLAHYGVLLGPTSALLNRLGVIHASRENAAAALRSDAVVLVFPGGDYDSYRPTFDNTIDFNGRTGYIRTALEADVPIVPTVSIGAQEAQLFLTRGNWLARNLGLSKLLRLNILPVSIGFPFGPSMLLPVNIPLPTKIVVEVLDPIDIKAQFGPDPDINEVDAYVRAQMQEALDGLASERRFPVIG